MKQIRLLLAVLMAFVFTTRAWAQTEERYAEVSTDGKTLTFYLDPYRSTRTGTTYDIPWGNGDPGWTTGPYSGTITTARFDGLFSEGDVFLTSTKSMFKNLTSLTVIEGLENLYTGEVTNMESMFENCSQLKQLDMIDFNISAVTNMNRMFCSCSSLESICCNEDWSMGNKVTTSTDMFAGCTNLKGAVSYASSNSNDIAYANPTTGYFTGKVEPYAILSDEGTVLTFYYDTDRPAHQKAGGESFGIPWYQEEEDFWDIYPGWSWWNASDIVTVNFDPSFEEYHGLTKTTRMFAGMENLTTINNIHNLHTENVTNMFGMFNGCKNLKEIDLTEFDTGNVTNTQYMFYGCSNLERIFCDDDWNQGNVVVESERMFQGCSKLKGYNSSNVDITFANPTTGYFTGREAYAVYDESNQSLTFYYDINKSSYEGIENMHVCEAVGNDWGMYTITSVRIDDSFKDYHGLTSTRGMFAYLYNITEIEGLANLNTENVTDMGAMFNECNMLKSLDLSSFDTSNVTDISEMFYDCSALQSLDLSSFDTRNVTLMSSLFFNCSNLTSIDLSNFNTSNVTHMPDMFYGCGALTLNLTSFDMTKVQSTFQMFEWCIKLTTIYCNDNWQKAGLDSGDMFNGCYALKGAVDYDGTKTDASMANPDSGYFTRYLHIAIDKTNFPDENFRNELLLPAFDKDQDGWFTTEEILGITEMNVGWRNIADLTGIEYFTALKELAVGRNNLTFLDLSSNKALERLNCSSNQLTNLILYENAALEYLDCQYNQLRELYVACCPTLWELSCNNNQLTSLILNVWDQTSNIEYLDCSNNNLKRIEGMRLNPSNSQYTLICHNNPITSEGMGQLVGALVTLGMDQHGTFKIYDETYTGVGAYCTSDHVAAATSKGWEVLFYDKETDTWTDFTGFPAIAIGDLNDIEGIDIGDANIIADYILGKRQLEAYEVIAADVNGDTKVTIADVTAIIDILTYDPTADKIELEDAIQSCIEKLENCEGLIQKLSEQTQTALRNKVTEIKGKIAAVKVKIMNAKTRDDIRQCREDINDIDSDIISLMGEIASLMAQLHG